MLHRETVLESTLDLLKELQSVPALSRMRLVGGTALALQLGHRSSVNEEGVQLAGLDDIMAMKLSAAANRGKKKDFLDIATLLETHSLSEMFSCYQWKFKVSEVAFALRGLTYFNDAEDDPMPIMFSDLTWSVAKERIQHAVRDFVRIG